jgi:hypothetical protein
MSTRWLGLKVLASLALASLATLTVTSPAQAQASPDRVRLATRPSRADVAPDDWPAWVHAIFVGVSGGYGYAITKHPDISTPAMPGPILSFQAGYAVSQRLTLGLMYTDFERAVSRNGGGEAFAVASSSIHTQAECNKCGPSSTGGTPIQATFRLATLGPSIDVTPFGRDGLFLGASGGVAIGSALSAHYGVGGTARGGFRFRPTEILTIAIEGGAQAQTFEGGFGRLGFGGAEIRLHL